MKRWGPTRLRHAATLALAAGLLAGCSSTPRPAPDIATSPWAKQSGSPRGAVWAHRTFPGKTPTHFEYARREGRDTVSVDAQSSMSVVQQVLRIEAEQLGMVRFSWNVPALIDGADMALRDKDDAPVRILLAFDGDRSRFSPKDAALSELARALTGEPLPYATLMYVWCNHRTPGSIIQSPRTDHVRKLVVESGQGGLNQWREYERDIRSDYERVFGEKPGALVGIAIMSDSDNTRSQASAWYGPVQLLPVAVR
jgi:hypothetical protein